MTLISPSILKKYGIPFDKVLSERGGVLFFKREYLYFILTEHCHHSFFIASSIDNPGGW